MVREKSFRMLFILNRKFYELNKYESIGLGEVKALVVSTVRVFYH